MHFQTVWHWSGSQSPVAELGHSQGKRQLFIFPQAVKFYFYSLCKRLIDIIIYNQFSFHFGEMDVNGSEQGGWTEVSIHFPVRIV